MRAYPLGLTPLSQVGRRWRQLNLIVSPTCFLLLALINPSSWNTWIPVQTSCGAITGLPCLFCGLTRGLHYLLDGDLSRAVYYNWLSIPFLVGVCLLLLGNALELVLGRNLIGRLPRPRFTPATLVSYLTGLVLLWVLQVYLAVSQHKSELLNPNGPLYSLVVRD